MSQRSGGKRVRILRALGAAGLVGLCGSQADATLLIDVRATGATTASAGVVGPKLVFAGFPGDTVTFGIFARVSGTDGLNNETMNSVYGLLNSFGSTKGNMSGGPSAPFTDSGFQNGSVVDWDSDGDLDIGASSTSSSATGKFFARNGTAGGYTGLTPVDANSAEALIGQVVWTVTAGNGDTEINFLRRTNNGGNVAAAALWFEDGSTVSKNPTNAIYTVGAPVLVNVPEPASLGLMGLASIALLGRRRKA